MLNRHFVLFIALNNQKINNSQVFETKAKKQYFYKPFQRTTYYYNNE